MMTEKEDTEIRPPKDKLSPFNMPDLTINIGEEKLYVNRDQLMEVSPVFRKMITFEENYPLEIEFNNKDPTTFALFLRHTLPGFDGLILPEETARLILPLAYEFQAETPLFKIDGVLATCMKGKQRFHLKTLIDELVLAELYSLPKYLTACIEKASTCSHKKFEIHPKFNEISGDTKSKIFLMRCAEMESKIEDCMQTIAERYCFCDECRCREKLDKVNNILNWIKEKDNLISYLNEI